jgi:hypothetical protein
VNRGPLGGRIVRLCTDDDELPEGDGTKPTVTPFVIGDARGNLIVAREEVMPKGQYDRSKSKPRGEANNDAAPAPAKATRKPRSAALVPKVAKPSVNAPAGRFDVAVDIRSGAVTINAASGSLSLLRDEVLALFAFLGARA